VKGKDKVVSVPKLHIMKCIGEIKIVPHISNSILGESERSALQCGHFTAREKFLYMLNSSLGWAQSQSGHCGEKKKSLPLPGIRLSCPVWRQK
jgi:hypothetical protein